MKAAKTFISLIVIAAGCLNSLPLLAQWPVLNGLNDYRPSLLIQSSFEMNASGVNNRFIGGIYYGRFLDDDLKNQNLDRLSEKNNLFAYSFDNRIRFDLPLKECPWGIYLELSSHSLIELRFPRNMFQLAFYGNSGFRDEFVPMNKAAFHQLAFQQIKAGVVKRFRKGERISGVYFGLGFNVGQKLLKFDIPEATFFTRNDGEFLALDMHIGMYRSDSAASGFGRMNGAGMSVDFGYFFDDGKNTLEIRVDDLGFIRWGRQSMHYERDTLCRWDGVMIPNIFDVDEQISNASGLDTNINAFAYSYSKEAFSLMIPMRGSIVYTRGFFKNLLRLKVGLSYRHFSLARPELSFSPSVNIPVCRSLLVIAPTLNYGGYGRLNCGLLIAARIGSSWYIELKSNYLNSLVLPDQWAGLGAFAGITKTF